MDIGFPAYALPEEHQALRESVRALADEKIVPRVGDIDRNSEFPQDVYEALVKGDLHAAHIPESYGGTGADAIATAIIIEEVARACARILADPAPAPPSMTPTKPATAKSPARPRAKRLR